MADKAWKAFERRVCAWWKTIRTALSGGNSKVTRSDSMDKILFIECKQRKRHTVISGDNGYDKAAALAKLENKIPILCLGEKNREGFWMVIHSRDAEDIAREIIERRLPELPPALQ